MKAYQPYMLRGAGDDDDVPMGSDIDQGTGDLP